MNSRDNKVKSLLINLKNIDIIYDIVEIEQKKYYIIYENEIKKHIKYVLYIHTENKKISLQYINLLIELLGKKIDTNNLKLKIISFIGYEEDAYTNEYINLVLEDESYFDYLLNIKKEDFIDLLPHNHNAYNKVIKNLENVNKTCVIQATGSGKSYLAAAIIKKYKNDNKIIVSSSNYILNQFINNFNNIEKTIHLFTYSKLSKVIENDIETIVKINPKIIILDEFHRAGAVEWSKYVNYLLELFPNAKIVGTSATPVRYLDNQRDMSKELFDNNISSQINLSEAIVNGILPMPKYITAFYTIDEEIQKLIDIIKNKMTSNYEKAEAKYLMNSLKDINNNFCKLDIILKKHITKERNFIIFCQNKIHLEEMKKILSKCFKLAFPDKTINLYKVFNSYSKSNYELNMFLEKENNENEFNLLFCVDKLNEGIHIKKVDGVILLRQTESPIIFHQQIGRALQTLNSNTPIIFDIVNNINNLNVDSFYNEIYSQYNKYKDIANELGVSLNDLEYYLDEIYDETNDILETIKNFELCLGFGWDAMYKKLCLYTEEFGNADVSSSYEDTSLAIWVLNQRQYYKKRQLSQDRIDKLNDINFKWEFLKETWDNYYDKLAEFIKQNNCLPSKQNCTDSILIGWVDRQRVNYKKNKLEDYKIEKLNAINFDFEPCINRWKNRYSEIYDKLQEYKNLDFLNIEENHHLRAWVYIQRENLKKGILSKEQIEQLNKIGIIENHRDTLWLTKYEELKEYYRIYNTKIIPVKYNGGKLKNWEKNQKKLYKLNKLSDFRKQKLDEIGFMN